MWIVTPFAYINLFSILTSDWRICILFETESEKLLSELVILKSLEIYLHCSTSMFATPFSNMLIIEAYVLWRCCLISSGRCMRVHQCFQFSGLINVATLIKCDIGELKLALSTRKMRVGNDTIVQKLTLVQVREFILNPMI